MVQTHPLNDSTEVRLHYIVHPLQLRVHIG